MDLFIPGDTICKDNGSNTCGDLAYRCSGEIRSSCVGYRKTGHGVAGKGYPPIRNLGTHRVAYSCHPHMSSLNDYRMEDCILSWAGNSFDCREVEVTSLTRRLIRCDIVAVGAQPLAGPFRGMIRREDIRATQRDQAEPALHYRPGDLIHARVVNLIGPGTIAPCEPDSQGGGDTTLSAARAVSASVSSTAYAALSSTSGNRGAAGGSVVVCLLSTAEPELGVVLGLGRAPDCPLANLLGNTGGAPLVPVSWTEMACPHTLARFPRKVARLPDELLTELVKVDIEDNFK